MNRLHPRRSAARPPAARRAIAVLTSLTFVVAACGGDDDTTSSEPSTVAEPAPASTPRLATCDGLADRWVEIQQGFLDDLGDAPVADGTASPEVIEAGRRMGLLLLEHGRDLERAGCDVELAPGSSPLCERLDQLSPSGPAGREVVEGLGADCA